MSTLWHVSFVFSNNFLWCFLSMTPSTFTVPLYSAVFSLVTVVGFYQISMESRHSLYWKLQSSCLKFSTYSFIYRVVFCKNEKVRDVHSSVTPCQHCPQHFPLLVKPAQMFAAVQLQVCAEETLKGFSIHTATVSSLLLLFRASGCSNYFLCYICGIYNCMTAKACGQMQAVGHSSQ